MRLGIETAADRSHPWLWYAVSAGIVFWIIHLYFMPALQPLACDLQNNFPLHALSIATALPTIAAFYPAWRYYRDGETPALQFLGALGLMLNALFLLAILAEWGPVFVINNCAS